MLRIVSIMICLSAIVYISVVSMYYDMVDYWQPLFYMNAFFMGMVWSILYSYVHDGNKGGGHQSPPPR